MFWWLLFFYKILKLYENNKFHTVGSVLNQIEWKDVIFKTYSGEVMAPVSGVVPERNQHFSLLKRFT